MNTFEFGICMNGLESAMERHLLSVVNRFPETTYVEIGAAYGKTLTAMASILKSTGKDWRAVGIDLPDGYSFDTASVKQYASDRDLLLEVRAGANLSNPIKNNVITLCLIDAQIYLDEIWDAPIHFAFIDGCHGEECVTKDFLNVSQFVPVGGMIAFHDFGEDSCGEPQVHCVTGNTRAALRKLGLLDDKYPGWAMAEHAVGDKTRVGRDLGVFLRV